MARLEELLAACVCRAEVALHARLLALDELVVDPVVGRVAVAIVVELFPLAALVGARAGAAGTVATTTVATTTVAAAVAAAVAATVAAAVAATVAAAVAATVAATIAGAVTAARRAGARAAPIAPAALLLLCLPLRTIVLRVVRVVALLLLGGSVGLAAGSGSRVSQRGDRGVSEAASQRSGSGVAAAAATTQRQHSAAGSRGR
jgi:hypothetical protein